jgi:hypothetical protein
VIAAAAELAVDTATIEFGLIRSKENFRDPEVVAKLGAALIAIGRPCVVVIDTYQAALGAGGNDCRPEDVTAFLQNVKVHLLGHRHTVLILHHFGKDQSRGGRGWSGLRASMDFEWEIDRDDDLRTLRVSKMRDGSDRHPAMCFKFHGRTLGDDQFGEPVTAVIVEHLDDEAPGRTKRHTPKAHALSKLIWRMVKDPSLSHKLPEGNGLRCVLMGELETESCKPGTVSRCLRETERKRQFEAALNELIEAGDVVNDENRVYPTPRERSENP